MCLPVGTVVLSSCRPGDGTCPCFDHLLEKLVHIRVVALITSPQTKELWQNDSEHLRICGAACKTSYLCDRKNPPNPGTLQTGTQDAQHPLVSLAPGLKLQEPLSASRHQGKAGLCKDSCWTLGTPQPSGWFQISYLCVLSAAVEGPGEDRLAMCVPCLILAMCWEKEKGLCDDNLACE